MINLAWVLISYVGLRIPVFASGFFPTLSPENLGVENVTHSVLPVGQLGLKGRMGALLLLC